MIKYIIQRIKNLNVKLVKIKGHSEIEGNNIADKLAKSEAIDSSYTVNVRCPTRCFNLQTAYWKTQVLDIPIRKFANIRNKLNHQSLWALNSNIRNLIVTDSQNYDMKSMWATLKKYRRRNNISFKHNNHHVFQIKLINHLLPTRANMRVLFPSIYSDNMCKLCNAEKDHKSSNHM